MDEKWTEACELLGGKISKTGEAEHCMLPNMEITFYPKWDRVLVSDHRSEGLNRIDLRKVEQILVFPDEDIHIISPKGTMKIGGRGKFVRIETDV